MTLSTHVIDGTYGRAAVGVSIRLFKEAEGVRTEQWRGQTDGNGCAVTGLGTSPARSLYFLELDINGYFATLGITPFFPVIPISFWLAEFVPSYEIFILITPSTYAIFKEG